MKRDLEEAWGCLVILAQVPRILILLALVIVGLVIGWLFGDGSRVTSGFMRFAHLFFTDEEVPESIIQTDHPSTPKKWEVPTRAPRPEPTSRLVWDEKHGGIKIVHGIGIEDTQPVSTQQRPKPKPEKTFELFEPK